MEAEMALFDSRGIDHVGIRYRDLPRAVAWFRDVLGLPIEHHTRTMAFVSIGDDGAQLALFQAESASQPRGRRGPTVSPQPRIARGAHESVGTVQQGP